MQEQTAIQPGSRDDRLARASWWILLVVLLLAAGIRYRLLDVPLERDEGEYAYGAQLILQGSAPYEQLYNMKLPGIYAAYAVALSVFGPTHTGIHAALLLLNAATTLLVFLLARRLVDPLAGLVAAGAFAVLSVSPSVQGMFANAEHFVILPAVGGLLLLLVALEKRRPGLLFASGLLLGSAFVTKQHAVAFLLLGVTTFLVHALRRRPLSWNSSIRHALALGGGMLLPYAATCGIFLARGSFGQFWFWTFEYARIYASQVTAAQARTAFQATVVPMLQAGWAFWILAAIGLSAPLWSKRARVHWPFLMLFSLFSFLAVCPGFLFRRHYFVLLLPAAAVLAGVAVSSLVALRPGRLSHRSRFGIGLLVAGIALGLALFQQRATLFSISPVAVSRATYGANPFPESLEIAKYIAAHTTRNDRIVVIGSEPQIYFYSGRRAATGFVYTYALMESHDFALEMQERMIREVESAEPAYIVYIDPDSVPSSWLARGESHRRLYDWIQSYKTRHYARVGLVEIHDDTTHYRWGAEARGLPGSRCWIEVLERRPHRE